MFEHLTMNENYLEKGILINVRATYCLLYGTWKSTKLVDNDESIQELRLTKAMWSAKVTNYSKLSWAVTTMPIDWSVQKNLPSQDSSIIQISTIRTLHNDTLIICNLCRFRALKTKWKILPSTRKINQHQLRLPASEAFWAVISPLSNSGFVSDIFWRSAISNDNKSTMQIQLL